MNRIGRSVTFLLTFALAAGSACSHQEHPRMPAAQTGAAQQAIVERSAA
jgi:hypothetical protein